MKILRWLGIICGILGLIGVRVVENDFFYDPFIAFFKNADSSMAFPSFTWGKLVVFYIIRFLLNLFFSLWIIQLIFINKKSTFQAFVLIFIFFVITFPIYLYCIYTEFSVGFVFSFYMRRFVIQPIILLLIIPLFYYRKKIIEKQV